MSGVTGLPRVRDEEAIPGIFVRLGTTTTPTGERLDGFRTMQVHDADAQRSGTTWFSTNSLATGIKEARVAAFLTALRQGERVPVYFMIGQSGGGTGQIEYVAELRDLASSAEPIPCPEAGAPAELGDRARIWLKLAHLRREQHPAANFVVDDVGSRLDTAVATSQYQFGYVRYRPAAPAPASVAENHFSEPAVLEHVLAYVAASGFRYSRALLLNYWISLKTKPFLILSGLSGSGKSKLPWLVAQAVGAQFCRVAVSPGWTEDSDLLGYVNPLAQVGVFEATAFTDFLLAAARDPGQNLWFLCLDEMNLARVEHYFAKFLSAMEGTSSDDRIVHLHDREGLSVPRSVIIPENFFCVGTVNMDETTHSFSPKVLDRANLIEFEVSPDDLRHDLPSTAARAPQPILLSWANFGEFRARAGDPRFRSHLVEIARILYRVQAHFGFRVREEIERYIANGAALLEPLVLLDLQVHQKILPKVRGSGSELGNVLRELHEYCAAAGLERSAAKVAEMLDRLLADGITSFHR